MTGLRAGLSDVRDATELIPISQSGVGWLLQLLALIALIASFVVRSFMKRARETPLIRRLVRSVRGWKLTRMTLGENGSDILADDEIDVFILYPIVAVAVLLAAGGVGLVVAASFYINFTFFKHSRQTFNGAA